MLIHLQSTEVPKTPRKIHLCLLDFTVSRAGLPETTLFLGKAEAQEKVICSRLLAQQLLVVATTANFM